MNALTNSPESPAETRAPSFFHAGRRTFLFQRPWLAYVGVLRLFFGQLCKFWGSSWRWFARRGGGPALELGLPYLLLVTTASVIHSRTVFSLGQFLQDLFMGTVVWAIILMLSVFAQWDVPAHLATGIVLGALAVTALLIPVSIAAVVLLSYLAILLLVTALSVTIFLPLRLCHWLWLQERRITYKCPYDDCRYRGLPIHICSCGAEYSDLEPNFYGIFYHTCHHADGRVKLPTLFGRNKLPRLCGGCRRPLLHSSLGELREWPIFVVGGPNAGKTIFLTQAVRRLLGERPGGTVRLDSETQQREYAERVRLLDRGQVLAKTAGDVMTALGLAARIPNGPRALVYLFDKPGEYFQSMRQFGRMQGIEGLKGILLLVDPFSLPGRDLQFTDLLKPSEAPFHTIASNLVHGVEQMLHGVEQRQCDVPVAVVLSKADAFPVAEYPFLSDLIGLDHEDPDVSHRGCRDALRKLGGDDSVRLLEQKFTTVRYFACTATGRMPDPRDMTPFRPAGVEQPLRWLLGGAVRQRGRAA